MSRKNQRTMQLLPVREKAVELYATNSEIRHEDAAKMLGVHVNTLYRMRKDPDFWQAVYDHYMVEFDGITVDVLKAMAREAKAGNVQAGRLILEHSGRLQKNINITVTSPYEKWLQINKNAKEAEVVMDELSEELTDDFMDLPPRKVESGSQRAKNEINKVRKIKKKAESRSKRNKDRKVWRKWQKRADMAGIDRLPARRPTPGQREAWEQKIIAAENQASKLPQEQADSNKIPYKPKNPKQEDQ
jgi:hypothetical protein